MIIAIRRVIIADGRSLTTFVLSRRIIFFVEFIKKMLNIQEQLLQEEDSGGASGAGAGEQEAAAGGQGRGQPRVEECVKSHHH